MAGRWNWLGLRGRPNVPFRLLFARFRDLLDNNTRILQIFADAAEKQSGEYVFDRSFVVGTVDRLFDLGHKVVHDLNSIADQKYADLYALMDRLHGEAVGEISGRPVVPPGEYCLPFEGIDEARANEVGGKSAHLGEIAGRMGVPIPPGFTITTQAYLRVLEANRLGPFLTAALERAARGEDAAFEEIRARFLGAKIPGDVGRAIRRSVRALEGGRRPLLFAIRSSALGEDEDLSFAGQYRTVLRVPPEGVPDAYREVLASLYSPDACAYRASCGLPAYGLMAVAVMRMVDAATAGVLHTVDPARPESGEMKLGAARGLADGSMGGATGLPAVSLSREPPHERRGPPMPEGFPSLDAAAASELASLGLRIERYFKQPQEIEWARDADGTLFILQARRLKVSRPPIPRDLSAVLRHREVLLSGRGHIACRGVAAGPVYVLRSEADLDSVPQGAVLVARRGSPHFVRVMPRVAAIVTDIGAPTGHMAALAREFRVPTIVDCGDASTRLASGGEVTVDADDAVVYAGRVEELLLHQLLEEPDIEDAPEYRLLRKILRRVTPLGLIDPQSDGFRLDRCRTLHDVIRFAHEKSVEEIIDRFASGRVSGAEAARRLESELPLNLQVIDVGGGLDAAAANLPAGAPIRPTDIRSAPMRAFWEGLTAPGVWSTRPVSVDFGTFLSSATSRVVGRSSGRNLAVVSDAYVNLSLNLGYHFNMVDAYLSDDREANHVYFRFVGGASDRERRERRASMVREILQRLDFSVRQSADLVVARLLKLPRAETASRLEIIGRLVGYSRQADAVMDSEEAAAQHAEAFLRGDYRLE